MTSAIADKLGLLSVPWFQPVKITGIKAYTSEVDQKEVILDLNIK